MGINKIARPLFLSLGTATTDIHNGICTPAETSHECFTMLLLHSNEPRLPWFETNLEMHIETTKYFADTTTCTSTAVRFITELFKRVY